MTFCNYHDADTRVDKFCDLHFVSKTGKNQTLRKQNSCFCPEIAID